MNSRPYPPVPPQRVQVDAAKASTPVGVPGAQHNRRAALVSLDLVKGDLEFPALGVKLGQLGRGRGIWVSQGGDEAGAVTFCVA